MIDFYEELVAGRPKSSALRRAVLGTQASYPDPQGWAAFTLIGLPD
jgi:CHAT domain-containing protein